MKKNYIKLLSVAIFFLTVFTSANAFPMQDKEYKQALIKSSGHSEYTLKNMKPIIGEKELAKVLKKYDNHPEKYQSDLYEKHDQKGVEKLTYRAGLHSHTTFSDGSLTPEETLNQAAEYANKVKAKHPFEKYPMIIAITDHFNTKGTIEAIDIIQKNPEKYKNIKFVIGMETEVFVKTPSQRDTRPLHVLVWCVNPYQWPFIQSDYRNPSEQIFHLDTYTEYVNRINQLKYGLISIAHPLRYFDRDETINTVIDELFSEYKSLENGKQLYTEGYYQPYRFDMGKEMYDMAAEKAQKYDIIRTGSQDTHGRSIFKN